MKKYLFLVVLAVLALTACVDDIVDENPLADGKYTLTVEASKAPLSKALNLDGTTLNASWTKDDVVEVYKGAEKIGELKAQSGGTSTTLKGSLDAAPSVNDELTLKYLSPSYSSQTGTLAFIAANCDYATATVHVKSVSGKNVTLQESSASFTNQQAIVKFTLLDNVDGTTPINATQLTISDGTSTYTVTPASATNELYVAILGFSEKTVTLTATDGNYNYKYEKSGVTFTNGQYYAISVQTSALQGSGTEEKPYLISSAADWNYLAIKVNSGTTYANKFFRQTASIDVTTMVGNSSTSRPFSGTYDGDGKTLNLNLNTTEPHTAPFRFISNAAVKNVVTTGTVHSTSNHPSGLVGETDGTCTIQNCRVSANVGGAQHSGGIVGHCWHADISIIGCVYSGTLSPASGQFTGGIIGWGGDGGGHTMTISNCLFAGSVNGSTSFHPVGIVQNTNNNRTVSNTYYTVAHNLSNENTHGNSFVNGLSYKGKFARSITAGTDVTINNLGAGTVYNVSGITAYTHGIKFNDDFFAGDGEAISLTLSHAAAPAGFSFSQYTVTGGGTLSNPTSNSPTLTMSDANQTINVEWAFNTLTFNYTGAVQTFTVPTTGYYTLECYGAQGGRFVNVDGLGGLGGTSQITYYLTAGTVLYVYVGGQGAEINSVETNSDTEGGAGGWNGGGKGGTGARWHGTGTLYRGGAGGGGATHIATTTIGPITSSTDFTANYVGLLLIAGGGGGGTGWGIGGKGGGDTGEKGSSSYVASWSIAWNNGTYSCGRDGEVSSTGSYSCCGCGGGGGGFQGGNTWHVTSSTAEYESYSGAGGSSWGETTNGKNYSTTTGGATDGGNGKAVITWFGTTYPM